LIELNPKALVYLKASIKFLEYLFPLNLGLLFLHTKAWLYSLTTYFLKHLARD